MIDWLSKNKIEVTILLFMGTLVNVGQYLQMHGFYLTFQDTDDYMRLVRTREFFNNYDLSNTIISRSNAPFGCDLHWTRFYDFFIIVPIYILNFFIGSIDKPIEYVCFFISPIVKSMTVAVFFNIVQKLMKKKGRVPVHDDICRSSTDHVLWNFRTAGSSRVHNAVYCYLYV